MATNDDRKKANGLQKEMETLLALEKLGALPPTAADEVRNIVAEGIANKFSEPYRTFPCTREGVQIRRDAVPKKCSLRESVEELVANASNLEKTKTRGRETPKRATSAAQKTAEGDRVASNALAQANKPQYNPSLTSGQPAEHNRAETRKTFLPKKQQPKACSSRANPTKGGSFQSGYEASLESGQKAWYAMLAKKAAEITTPSLNDDKRKSTAQGADKPSAPIIQGAGAESHEGRQIAAAAVPNNGTSAHKRAMTSQSLEATVVASGEGTDRQTIPRESVKPPSKPSTDSSEDLIDLGF
ncbi:hypothetical protein DHEL01_v204864 [Diaporthe helianthi]|uniref:Uncharacterized protein n=1 Tax=Diaporthe helianthi TaxID=158607 RepID=A0A2P5I2P4_DIAHE|nr:hypothetical protein DHEL01_v204864 [Diaporthe helianthi]